MATLQGKAVKNTYRQVLQIGANNLGVSGTLQPVQDGSGVNTALSLSTITATVNGDLTVTGDLIITGGGLQIKELIDDTVANLIKNGTGITWTYNDAGGTLTGNFTGTTTVVPEGSNLYYTQARFDSAFAAKSTTNLAEGTNLYFTTARGDANFATNFATKTTTNLPEGTNLYFTNARARAALSITAGTGISYDNTTGVFNLAAIPNASLTNSSITINGQVTALGSSVTLTTTNIAEGTNLYFTNARARTALSVTAGTGIDYNSTTGVFGLSAIPNASLTNSSVTINSQVVSLGSSITLTTTNIAEGTNLYWTDARFDTRFSTKTTTNLTEGTNLYYTQARFNTAFAAKSTTDLAEGTNLYYTDARARLAISESAVGLDYSNTSGVLSLTAGYAIPTTVKLGQYDTAYNRSIVSAAVTGTTTKTLTLTEQDANTITATWTDLGITTINGTANQIAATTVGNTTTIGFTNDVTMPNNLIVSGNLTINGTATYVNTQSISAKDPLFEVANDNNTTDAVDIGYYGRYYDSIQERIEFTGLFRDASNAGKFKFFTGLVDEPTNVVNTSGVGYTVGTLVANFEGNLAGTANAANVLSTARSISATGDAAWTVNFDGSANATAALTLANTGVTATTYGTSTAVPTIAIDSKGRITSASNTNIAFPVTSVNGASGTVVLTTTNIAEGTNQYFTSGRAQSAITISTTGTSGAATYTSGNINVPIYIGGSGSINEIAAFDTTGTISSLSTATYPSLTELSYVKGVTSAIQTQLNSKLNLSGGTLTGGLSGTTGTFSGILITPQVKAATSAGLSINANSGTQVADFGAGGGANMTLFGGLSGTSATFSSTLAATSASFSSTATATAFIPSGSTVPTNGMYLSAANTLNFATNTTNRLTISSAGAATFSNSITATEGIFSSAGVDGSLGSVVRISSTDTNGNARNWALVNTFESYGDLNFRISTTQGGNALTAGTTIMTLNRSGNVGIGTAIPTAKLDVNGEIRMTGSTLFRGMSSSTLQLCGGLSSSNVKIDGSVEVITMDTNGVTRMAISSAGNVAINQFPTPGNIKFKIRGSDTTGSNYSFYIDNGVNEMFFVRNDGLVLTGSAAASPYNLSTTGRSAVIESNGVLGYLVSTRESKANIKSIKNVDFINQLNPVQFNYRKKDYNTNTFTDELYDNITYGFIADEVEQVNKELVMYNEDGSLGGVEYNSIIAILTKAVQEQQAQIEELKAMIAAK
jgi:hypothetical protein